ncbi:TIGR01777 family oxidoreductase [uncultured Microscilla sp.]|uniref:TIGR01777 family oxidoreductase n=1 Tax=uncultured Microscilla sp. TaxID=432653 RepID=UPI002618BDFC|nr:TIGR01777 family oxidoreductase [uncultured Microscilla sp.]
MTKTILITGGTGLIGQRLTELLLAQKGYSIRYLSRSKRAIKNVEVFEWHPQKGEIDATAFEGVDAVVHLAGAGVADKRWTESRKDEILKSRTQSTELIAQTIRKMSTAPKALVNASAIGYYGINTGAQLLHEESPAGNDFLAEVTSKWENATKEIEEQGIRTVKIRVGVVLSPQSGALPKLLQPVRLGLGAPLGSGDQYMSWIHIDDIARIFMKALEDETMRGAYNGVAPAPVTNAEMTKRLASVVHRPAFLPNVPAFMLKMMLGEMASIVLEGNKVSCDKIIRAGFEFEHPGLTEALKDLLKEN